MIKTKLIEILNPEYNKIKAQNIELISYVKVLQRFIDKQVISNQIQKDLTTDGEIKDVAIMFTDVRGFTKLSENISLKATNSFLNNYYDIVTHHIQKFDGIIDKFIGDGAMAIFGAFDSEQNYTENCVLAAKAILKDFKMMISQKHEPDLFLGIGITKGPAILGTFGNGEFVNFTAIGHTVNLAARVQSIAENNQIYVTKSVIDSIKEMKYQHRGDYKLKNVSQKLDLYEILT